MNININDIAVRYTIDGIEKRAHGPGNEDLRLELCQNGNRTTITIKAEKPIQMITSSFEVPYEYAPDDHVYVNGYQSWTDTREFALSEYLHDVKKVPRFIRNIFHFDNYGDAWFMDYQKDNFHSFTYAYLKKKDGSAHLGLVPKRACWQGLENRAGAHLPENGANLLPTAPLP